MGLSKSSDKAEELDFGYFEELLMKSAYSHNLESMAIIAGDNPECFRYFYLRSFEDNPPISMRASAVLERISRKHPEMLDPYRLELIEKIPAITDVGLKRNVLKALRYIPFTDTEAGLLLNPCFDAVQSTSEKPAIRVYAMDILLKIVEKYPELHVEFQIILEQEVFSEIPSIAAHTRQILAKLNKLKPNSTSPEYE